MRVSAIRSLRQSVEPVPHPRACGMGLAVMVLDGLLLDLGGDTELAAEPGGPAAHVRGAADDEQIRPCRPGGLGLADPQQLDLSLVAARPPPLVARRPAGWSTMFGV